MSEAPARVLVVDDDPHIRESLMALLQMDFEVTSAGNIAEARLRLDEREVDVVVTDYDMPGGTGLELVKVVRERHSGVLVILLTGMADLPELKAAESEDAVVRVLSKPYDPRRVVGLVRSATQLSRVNRQLNAQRKR